MTQLVPKQEWKVPAELASRVQVACRRIADGANLLDLQDEGFITVDDFLYAINVDGSLHNIWTAARAISAYFIEDDLTRQLHAAIKEPHTSVELRALHEWAEHRRWQTAVRNPGKFSPRAEVKVTVPIQINTSLDMADQSSKAGVYELKATISREVPVEDLTDEQLGITDASGRPAKGHASGTTAGEEAEAIGSPQRDEQSGDAGVLDSGEPGRACLEEERSRPAKTAAKGPSTKTEARNRRTVQRPKKGAGTSLS